MYFFLQLNKSLKKLIIAKDSFAKTNHVDIN